MNDVEGSGFHLQYSYGCRSYGGGYNPTKEERVNLSPQEASMAACLRGLRELPIDFYARGVELVFEKNLRASEADRRVIEEVIKGLKKAARKRGE
jgi:hypothetical protein